MKFDVFLPSLLVSPHWFADSSPPRLPAIEILLAHGRAQVGEEWPKPLLARFGVDGGIAAISAYGDAINTDEAGWVFAEPAHFQADRDTVNLFPASHLDISADEAAQLLDALNANFDDRGLVFSSGAAGRWYVRCDALELPQTTSIAAAQRGTVFEKLPQSTGKLSWRAIQNEAQMLFHSYAVNEQREASRRLTINGLWFWGEGVLPTLSMGSRPVSEVFGDTPLSNGLAKLSGATTASLDKWDLVSEKSHATDKLLVLDALTAFHERGDMEGWREAALELDVQIFTPLLASLRNGVIDEVILTLPRTRDSLVVTITAASLRGVTGWWNNMSKRRRSFLESAHA